MEIRTLTTFLKIAETQSFTQAAALLGYSQAAVTIQIRQLEKELNVSLFDRIGRQVSLTDKGRQLLVYANTIIDAAQQAAMLGQDAAQPEGLLRLGAVDSLACTLLPDLLYRFQSSYPLVKTSLEIFAGIDVSEALRHNQVDALFSTSHIPVTSEFHCAYIKKSPLNLIAANGQFSPDHQFTPQELTDYRFVLTELHLSYRHQFDQWLAQYGLHVEPILTLPNPQIIIELVSRGLGLSFLPEYTFQSAVEEKKIAVLNVPGLDYFAYIQLLYHRNKRITPPMRAFFDLVTETL